LYDKPEAEDMEGARWGPAEAAWRARGHVVGEVSSLLNAWVLWAGEALPPALLPPSRVRPGDPAREAVFRAAWDHYERREMGHIRVPDPGDRTFADVEPKYRHWKRHHS
jgi:hypothetical protein